MGTLGRNRPRDEAEIRLRMAALNKHGTQQRIEEIAGRCS